MIKFGPKDKWLGILAPKETLDVHEEIKSAPADAKWVLTSDSHVLAETVDDLSLVCEYTVKLNR